MVEVAEDNKKKEIKGKNGERRCKKGEKVPMSYYLSQISFLMM